MKKTIIWSVIALLCGGILGKLTFDKYEALDVSKVIKINPEVYALEYGHYANLDEMADDVTNVDRYIYIEKDDKISAYVALATSLKQISKIKKIYDKKDIKLVIKKINIDNDAFIQNLNEYEKLLKVAEDEKALLIIENQILSNYEDTVVKDE